MGRAAFGILLSLLALGGAGCGDDGESLCGEGIEHEHEGVHYCAYSEALVIEGGFLCPTHLPFRFDLMGAVICADRAVDEGDLPEELCRRVGRECGEPDAGFDEGPGDDGGRPGDGGGDEGFGDDGGRPDGGVEDAGGDDGGPLACTDEETPTGGESRQVVRFQMEGPPGTFVATNGFFCGAFDVEGLVLGLPFQCGCECPPPEAPHVTRAEDVGPDGSTEPLVLEWDARELLTYRTCLDCGPGFTEEQTDAVPAPASPGTYTARFAVWDEVPADCTVVDGVLTCSDADSGGVIETTYELCPSGRVVEVTFDLPASGDVTVPVDVSP